MHETQFKIRSTQVDSFGHLNNAAYLEIYEWARWEWAEDFGMGLEAQAKEKRIGPAVLHVDLSFFKELVMHETITVRTWVDGNEGLKGFVCQEMIKADGAVASHMRMTFVMFHLDKRRVVSMPEAMLANGDADADYAAMRRAKPRSVKAASPCQKD